MEGYHQDIKNDLEEVRDKRDTGESTLGYFRVNNHKLKNF